MNIQTKNNEKGSSSVEYSLCMILGITFIPVLFSIFEKFSSEVIELFKKLITCIP